MRESSSSSDAGALIDAARRMLARPDPNTAGIWPRGAALLTHQALETALQEFWRQRAPGLAKCSWWSQLLCQREFLRRDELGRRVAYAWVGLSQACHYHAYELPPTAGELQSWMETVSELIAAVRS